MKRRTRCKNCNKYTGSFNVYCLPWCKVDGVQKQCIESYQQRTLLLILFYAINIYYGNTTNINENPTTKYGL